jgi:hypothetical protein
VAKENVCKAVIIRHYWLGYVRECRPSALSKPRKLPAMDAFRGHLSNRLRNRLKKKKHRSSDNS